MGQGGRRDPSEYVAIKAVVAKDPQRNKNCVVPCDDEIFPNTMKIECSRSIRDYQIGTVIELFVVETNRDGGKSFLYSSYKWKHKIISKPKA